MTKRTATHRGTYKAKSNATEPMPLLLRRALAQVRGDPPESWLNSDSPYVREYPFPIMELWKPHLRDSIARADLLVILKNLDHANLGSKWRRLGAGCTKVNCDAGDVVLFAIATALTPVITLNVSTRKHNAKRVIEAARELTAAIESMRATGQSVHALMPPDPTALPGVDAVANELNDMVNVSAPEPRLIQFGGQTKRMLHPKIPSDVIRHTLQQPDVLLALLRYVSTLPIGTARQTRGNKWQRYALAIARNLNGVAGITTAVNIANAATGARITVRGLTKNRN